MTKKFRVKYVVMGKGFKLGEEAMWLNGEDFEDDMDEIDIMVAVGEAVDKHFSEKYQYTVLGLVGVVEQIKQYLQGENNELA